MNFVYGSLLAAGLVLLVMGLVKFRERVTFVMLGLGISITQAVLMMGEGRSAQGAIAIAIGACFGIVGSLKLINDTRRRGGAFRPQSRP